MYKDYRNIHHSAIIDRILAIKYCYYVMDGTHNNLNVLAKRGLIKRYNMKSLNMIFYGYDNTMRQFIHYDESISECNKRQFLIGDNIKFINMSLLEVILKIVQNSNLNDIAEYIVNEIEKIICDKIIYYTNPYEMGNELTIDIIDLDINSDCNSAHRYDFDDRRHRNDRDRCDEIKYENIKFINEELCVRVIENDYMNFRHVPKYLITITLCEKLINCDNIYALKYIPNEYKTYKLCVDIVAKMVMYLNMYLMNLKRKNYALLL